MQTAKGLSVGVSFNVSMIGNQSLKIWLMFGFHGDWPASYWQIVDESKEKEELWDTGNKSALISVVSLFIHSNFIAPTGAGWAICL